MSFGGVRVFERPAVEGVSVRRNVKMEYLCTHGVYTQDLITVICREK